MDQIVYRAPHRHCPIRQRLQNEGLTTMDKVLKYGVSKHGKRNCIGTRKILEERKVTGPDGRTLTKLVMEPKYRWLNYDEVYDKSTYIGRGLHMLGLRPRDKLVMYCDTKAEWMVTAMGCFKFNYTLVTIYTNLGADGVAYGVNQTQAQYICTSQELLPKLIGILDRLPHVHTIIVIEEPWKGDVPLLDAKYEGQKALYTWKAVYTTGKKNNQLESNSPLPDDVAILMYTSGSTGNPKGVMLTHENIVNALFSIVGMAEKSLPIIRDDDAYIAYLPLAHVLELLAESVMFLLGIGIGYSNPHSLTDSGTMIMKGARGDAPTLRPTIMAAVPVILDKIYKGINTKIRLGGKFKTDLVDFCIRYRADWLRRGYDTPIMNKLVFSKFSGILGGRVRLLLSGGAPLAEEAHQFIRTALCLSLHQGYGLTETCATAIIMDTDDISVGRVGTPLQGVDIKIVSWNEGGYSVTDQAGARGEIHIGGPHVAAGYYNMPEKTAEDFYEENGKRWFRTGDIGQAMQDGSFRIIDRKKDLVKLQMGEYVSLGKVESILKIHSLLDNICVYAKSSESFAVAVVVPDEVKLMEFSEKLILKKGMPHEELCRDFKVIKEVLKDLTNHGLKMGLEKFEIPKQIVLIPELWTPDSGLVTAAMKLKRKDIEKKYSAEIEKMYSVTTNTQKIDMKSKM